MGWMREGVESVMEEEERGGAWKVLYVRVRRVMICLSARAQVISKERTAFGDKHRLHLDTYG